MCPITILGHGSCARLQRPFQLGSIRSIGGSVCMSLD
jgi:hypothetical protein